MEWFRQNLVVGKTDDISPAKTLELCENPEGKLKVLEFLNTADISIDNIEVESIYIDKLPDKFPLELKQKILQQILRRELTNETRFSHKTLEGRHFSLSLEQESAGTVRLFESTSIWLEILEQGRMICIDELESSLHPLITRFLVSLFHHPEINQKQAQLIFTTHDTNILDNDILHRDQIWFVEKDSNQSTRLYPLSDFSSRKNEALQKGYLQGRYGALPYISSPKWLK